MATKRQAQTDRAEWRARLASGRVVALCPQWLRDRANLLRSKAHEVEHAYNGDAIAPWLVRTATAYRRAAAVLEVEADTMLAEFAAARKGD